MENKTLTPLKAIREHCLECQGFSPKAVRNCQSKCRFYDYRLGKHPRRQGVGGFKTHKKNRQMHTQVLDSSNGINDNRAANTNYASPLKPFITNEMAETMIKAANVIIETTKSAVA